MGPAPDVAVVSTRQRVWNVLTAEGECCLSNYIK
jgi:hypothetical protein